MLISELIMYLNDIMDDFGDMPIGRANSSYTTTTDTNYVTINDRFEPATDVAVHTPESYVELIYD